ncbi:uncharacterized protein [Triticum aestivum]|uniref:uncharacterized protein n=1 Tax=Triticum aestivum TaxID=4565 RepID=UPI001D0242FE|nr:uncharacterized protein LOC123182719 [Triticum aestivum]
MWELVLLCCGHHQDSVVSLVIIDVSNVSVRVRWTAGRVPMKPFLQIQGCDCLVHPYHEIGSSAGREAFAGQARGVSWRLGGIGRIRAVRSSFLACVQRGAPLLVTIVRSDYLFNVFNVKYGVVWQVACLSPWIALFTMATS